MNSILPFLIALLALSAGCSRSGDHQTPTAVPASVAKRPLAHQAAGCRGCHPLSLDRAHDLPCEECHQGDVKASQKPAAHAGLIRHPASPERMASVCGRCHGSMVEQVAATLHFTLEKEVNLVRKAFGAKESLASLTAIPLQADPQTPGQLADDLLRRRCLRCHPYSPGDAYPATRHGTGCGACHLAYADGVLTDHRLLARPTDRQCLSCHYGNRVGADYYGRFEHDVHWDFRTPFPASSEEQAEPYGVGFHQLVPDLHQQAGMMCIDCHGGLELMAGEPSIRCRTCHDPLLRQMGTAALTEREGRRELVLAATGRRLAVPVMMDPAHDRYGEQVGCEVCHAKWSFADYGNHLLRQDDPDYEPWQALTRQGSAEVEAKLEAALFLDQEGEATMIDGITGDPRPGIWLGAYELRRWEEINTCLDDRGVLQVCRPILDLHLSYTDREGEVRFDGERPVASTPALLPYTPHTTGRAGAFYRQRLTRLVNPLP